MIDRTRLRSLFEDIYAARVAGESHRFADHIAPGAVYRSAVAPTAAVPFSGEIDLATAVGQLVNDFRFHRLVIKDLMVDGDRVAIHLEADVGRGDGPAAPMAFLHLYRFDASERVVELIEFSDSAAINAL